MKCLNCGAVLNENAKFCSKCGTKIEDNAAQNEITCTEIKEEKLCEEKNTTEKPAQEKSFWKKLIVKFVSFWKGLDLLTKICSISLAVLSVLLIVSVIIGNGWGIFLSIYQIGGLIVVLLMHKSVIKLKKSINWLKYLILLIAILFTILNVASFTWGSSEKTVDYYPNYKDVYTDMPEPTVSLTANVPFNAAECVGKTYFEIETLLDQEGFDNITFEKIEDLKWADSDKKDIIESVSINGKTDFAKGDEFNKNDLVVIEYHAYAQCAVTLHVDFIPNLLFNRYDVEVFLDGDSYGIMNHGEDKDFEFSLYPGEYTLEFANEEDSSVDGALDIAIKGTTDISVTISNNSDNINVEIVSVEDQGDVAENEVMITSEWCDYKGKDYEEYSSVLKDAGFLDISVEPIYDIAPGATGADGVEEVIIDGKTDFKRGEIYVNSAPIVIRYHAYESEDPAKQAQAKLDRELEAVFPKEMARRSVVVALTNCYATDVFSSDGNSYNPKKFHSYDDIDNYFMTIERDGVWAATDEGDWYVEDIVLRIFNYDTYLKASCNVKFDEEKYTVFNLDCTIAAKEYIDSYDSSKISKEHYEPSENTPFLTVPEKLIEKDRDTSAVQQKVTEAQEQAKAAEERRIWIENQFHWWDGRHTELSELIKDNLNDSKSFEHVDASFIDISDAEIQKTVNQTLKDIGIREKVEIGDLFVIQEFTAKNAFNATIKSVAYGVVKENSGTVILLGIF